MFVNTNYIYTIDTSFLFRIAPGTNAAVLMAEVYDIQQDTWVVETSMPSSISLDTIRKGMTIGNDVFVAVSGGKMAIYRPDRTGSDKWEVQPSPALGSTMFFTLDKISSV